MFDGLQLRNFLVLMIYKYIKLINPKAFNHQLKLCLLRNMLALDFIITESSVCNLEQFKYRILYRTFETEVCAIRLTAS